MTTTTEEIEQNNKEYKAINFGQKLSLFNETWSPKIIAEMNDYQFKLVKLTGEFVWHSHEDTDETFIILEGQVRINFRDGSVTLKEGEMYVVPKGKQHKPQVEEGETAKVLLIEPKGVINTGDAENSDKTAPNEVWI